MTGGVEGGEVGRRMREVLTLCAVVRAELARRLGMSVHDVEAVEMVMTAQALGVDDNIFLIARTREDVLLGHGTRAAVLRALAATGGVITSAGVLLAAVFAVLGVLPVITLTQIGVLVGVGVLLDTLLVRTVLVPALVLLTGRRFWWLGDPERGSGGGVGEQRGQAPLEQGQDLGRGHVAAQLGRQ